MKKLKIYSSLFGIILAHYLWVTFIQNVLYPIHFAPHNLFILDLIGKEVNIPGAILFLLDAGNIILLWLISSRIFANRFSLIPSIIYAISPWSSYLVAAGSFYIYLSFLLLLALYGLVLIKFKCKFWGIIVATGSIAVALYSSLFLSILVPFVFIIIAIFGVIPFNRIKKTGIFLIILMLPLLFCIYSNRPGFNNIFKSEITIFSDPGLLNTVNSYQGAAKQENLGKLAKVSENKYVFFTEFVLLKYIKQLVPSTYFTSQEKLLNFSFSPPIYLGFLIPFLYGLYLILKSPNLRKILFLSIVLVVPSILSKRAVDLNRQILFAPVIIFVISFGFIKLYEQKKKTYLLLILSLSLVILQFLVTSSDLQLREKDRYLKYYGRSYEIGRQ